VAWTVFAPSPPGGSLRWRTVSWVSRRAGLLGICALGIVLGLGCQGDEDRSVERPSEDGEFTLQVENVERVTDVPDAVGFAPPSGTTSYASIDLSIMKLVERSDRSPPGRRHLACVRHAW